MHVLVVGGAGYIGSHVVWSLLDHGHRVTVFDDLSSGFRENVPEAASFVEGDMSSAADLEALFRDHDFEAAVHLAALKAAGDSMFEPERFSRHNIVASMLLLEYLLGAGVKRLLFSSSAAVFGNPHYEPMDEEHPKNPTNYYGFTKLHFERQMAWFGKLRGLQWASLRYFNAAGYDVKGRVPGLEQNPKNLIPIVMEVACGLRPCLEIYGADYPTRDGSCVRDYVHVTDLADAHVAALECLERGEPSLVCNLGSETGHSVFEVVKAAEKVCGMAINHKVVGRRAGDPASLTASASKAKERLAWQAKHSDLETIIQTTWEAYRRRYKNET